MNPSGTTMSPANGTTTARDLFALTDEQILEIDPAVGESAVVEQPPLDSGSSSSKTASLAAQTTASIDTETQAGTPTLTEPPAWLAMQMKDPWAGDEARELWEGVQRAQAEAAEYKQVFEKPEAARTAAKRARSLDEFDAAYFGVAGKSPEEASADRAALAQRMMREDPAAFQEMVLAGVKALEEAKRPGSKEPAIQTAASPTEGQRNTEARQANPEIQQHLASYSEFEKAANQDLEKSVGGAIERSLQQALPNAGRGDSDGLRTRLASGVRQEIEKTLQGDRQLGEQVAQVLAARRFDETARAQVVRLINERAQQLLPSATKRVLKDWTQTTLAAHRSKTEKKETAGSRADLAAAQQGRERAVSGSESQQRHSVWSDFAAGQRGRVDYKKLSDEQILEL